jgi:membrane-bound lytic murein transglycosylase B
MLIRLSFLLLGCALWANAIAAELPGIPEFIDEMVVKHHFKRRELTRLFERAEYQQAVIDAITAPATQKPWLEYRASFITDKHINDGLKFWKRHAHTLARAERKYGVPQEIIVALIGVETFYGQRKGRFRTVDALTTLAFNYPQRAPFFRTELENYLLLARDQGFNLLKVQGSYAGALGIPQFMPSSYRKYAVDFNGNGRIDLLNDQVDAIGSVGNYLKAYGWIKGEPVARLGHLGAAPVAASGVQSTALWAASGVFPVQPLAEELPARLVNFTVQDGREYWLAFKNFDVIMRYNNSSYYAMSVLQLSEALRDARHNKYVRNGGN